MRHKPSQAIPPRNRHKPRHGLSHTEAGARQGSAKKTNPDALSVRTEEPQPIILDLLMILAMIAVLAIAVPILSAVAIARTSARWAYRRLTHARH